MEISIDLSTEELLQDPQSSVPPKADAVNAAPRPATPQTQTPHIEDAIEIELTAEQIDALLNDRL